MLVFSKEQLVILAVPKTGTTAISAVLAPRASMVLRSPPAMKHTPMRRYHRFLRPFVEQSLGGTPEIMAIVRNPIDWLGSWYRYRSREALQGHENSTIDVSFDDFVLEYCKGTPAPFAALGSQSKFVRLNDGQIGVDHLFKYEAQDKIRMFLEDRLGGVIDLPRKNVSPRMELALSPEVSARLHAKRPEEFETWEQAQS
ncbi:sulfotransferase family 2 domain-containing protein [Yoonia sp. I 8.24]|uniref:sulfotransferase family 2 domain-containing protein n=1 Tax=Yoonia sp. I 8.24 TaxID=1537229 RepID=UPI001EDD51D8|nr:sulfotransferase family 2 domain-containing protein [Yoonia sp. I 8.24]MCG3267625.1 gamma-glutamyl kinase [Yoonia sp. I 8.24]